MSKINLRNDETESDDRINAKNTISQLFLHKTVSLTDHNNKTIIINPDDIKCVIQEFSWFIKQANPRKTFSGDVVLIDCNNNIIAIIEIVKTHGISINKYSFYQKLDVFWLELSVDHILTENEDFYSSYSYNFKNVIDTDTKKFLTELDLKIKKPLSQTQQICNQISKLNILIKRSSNNKTRQQKLRTKKQELIEQITPPYIKQIRLEKYENSQKIKELRAEINLLKEQRLWLKKSNKPYYNINSKIKNIRNQIQEYKIKHLSKNQLKIREKNIKDSKNQKKIRTQIIKISNKKDPCIELFNILERLSKTLKTNKIDISYVIPHFLNYKTKLANLKQTKAQLESFGWSIDNDIFSRI